MLQNCVFVNLVRIIICKIATYSRHGRARKLKFCTDIPRGTTDQTCKNFQFYWHFAKISAGAVFEKYRRRKKVRYKAATRDHAYVVARQILFRNVEKKVSHLLQNTPQNYVWSMERKRQISSLSDFCAHIRPAISGAPKVARRPETHPGLVVAYSTFHFFMPTTHDIASGVQ